MLSSNLRFDIFYHSADIFVYLFPLSKFKKTFMIYKILSSSPAPERDIISYDLEKFIEICEFNLDNLKDWFESYRYCLLYTSPSPRD